MSLFFNFSILLGRDDVMCPLLTPPTNGSIDSEDGRSVGSMATYSCGEGFVLIGPEQRSCQSNGAWSEPEPTCERETTIRTLGPFITLTCSQNQDTSLTNQDT